MKHSYLKGLVVLSLISAIFITGCKRKISPEEFAKNLHPQYTLNSNNNPVLTIAYSPDGKLLVTTDSQGEIIFWDPETGEQKKKTNFHNMPLYAMAFSPDGKYIAMAGKDQAIILFDARKIDTPPTSFVAHNDDIYALAWGPNHIFASASCIERDPRNWCIKGEVAVWKLEKIGQNPLEVKRFPAHGDWINAIAVSPNGKYIATGGGDNVINLYSTKTWEHLKTLHGHTGRISALAFPARNSSLLGSTSMDGTVRVWSVPDGDQEKLMKSEGGKFMAMAFNPDGKMVAAGGADQKIMLWLTKKEKVLKELAGLEGQVSSLAFSPDGTALAAGLYDSKILVWKAEIPK